MNRHPGLFSLALLGIALTCSLTASSLGQAPVPAPPTPAPVPAPAGPAGNIDALKASPNVATAVPTIAAHIKAQVAKLASGDPAAAAQGRDELIENVSPGRVAPSPAFLAEFARQLDTGIAPALQHENEYVRLNAGIVVAKAAERTDSGALSPATLILLNDKSRNVVLWGVKAARWVIPALLRVPPAGAANPLLAAVVKAVGTHGQGAIGGPIVVEAYDALTIDAMNSNAKRRPTAAMITTVIPFMHQLLQQRILAYQKGIPPEPAAESRGTLFLVEVWGSHTPPQRVTSIQAMSDIIGLGAQHAAANPPAGDLADLGYMIGLVSKAIAVVPQNQPIAAQLGPAMKVDARANAASIQAAVAAVVPALKTVKDFAAITPPPAITPVAAPANNGTAPTTAPTTAATAPATTASSSP